MAPTVLDLLVRPATFFGEGADRPSLVGPALVAGALGATLVGRLLILLDFVGDHVDVFEGSSVTYAVGELAVAARRELLAAALFLAGLFFVAWVLTAGIIFVVSRVFDTGGSFRRLLAYVGWGQVPTLFSALLSGAYLAYAIATAPELTSTAAADAWGRATFQESPVRQALELLDPVFAFWTAYLWLLATEHALDLTRRKALVCVTLPAGVVVLEAVSGALGALT